MRVSRCHCAGIGEEIVGGPLRLPLRRHRRLRLLCVGGNIVRLVVDKLSLNSLHLLLPRLLDVIGSLLGLEVG